MSAVNVKKPEQKPRSPWTDVWVQFRKHRLGVLGACLLGFLIIMVLAGPLVYPTDPEYIDVVADFASPTLEHPLGTDNLGRDILARVLVGGRVSMAVGVSVMLFSIFCGTAVGGLAGYFPKLDAPLMRFADMLMSLPRLPILLVTIMVFRDTLRTAFGPETGIFLLIVFVMSVMGWMGTARIVRAQVLTVKELEFVTAATCIGTGQSRILLRHILPNVLSPVMVAATLGVAGAILGESVLSFLGLGFPPDFATWGRLLYDGLEFFDLTPHPVFWPGLFISLTVLSVNFVGDALRDALDPRARRRV